MPVIGTILIVVLLIALYAFIGYGVYMIVECNDYKYNFDADDYILAIVMFWPLMIFVFITVAIIQLVNLVFDIIHQFKE